MSPSTILCVDDERNVLLTLRTQLMRHFPDCAIEIAESGAEALDLINEIVASGGEVPLVIADQIMPGMRGDELLIELHSRYPQMVKVMLTGQARAEDVGNALNRGQLYRFLSKPWKEADLTLTVTEALRRYRQEQQIAQQQIALEQANQKLTDLNADLEQQIDDRTQALTLALDFNQQVIATVQEGVIVWDQTLRYQVWNRFMENLSGLPAATVLNQHCLDLFPFLQENGIFALLQRALAGETVFAPDAFFNMPSTGKSGWTSERFTPLRDAQGTIVGVLGTVHDITERKQTEIALQESEAHNRAILSSIPDIMTVLNAEGQYLSYSHNQFVGELLPLGDRDLTGMYVTDVLPQEAASQWLRTMQRTLTTGQIQVHEQHLRFGDRMQYEEVRMVPYQEDRVLCLVRDITAEKSIEAVRQQAEAALQQSATRLAEAQRIAQLGNWEFDLATRTVSWSAELFHLFGRDPAQGQPTYDDFRQQIPPKDWPAFEQVIERSIAEGLPYEIEHGVICPDGDRRYAVSRGEAIMNPQGQVIKLFGTTQDVTVARQAQEALRVSEQRYATLAEAAPVGIFRFDASGDCIYVNEYWCEMSGWSTEESLGKNWIQTLHPDDRDRIPAEWAQAIEQQGGFYRSEGRVLRPDGTVVWFYCQGVPETDAQGRVTGYVGTVTDISDRKQAEANLIEAEAQLRASQEQLHLALEFTGIGAWSWQPATGDYEWNGKMEDLLELPPGLDDMFEQWCDRIHPEDVDRVQANIQQALDTQTAFAEEYRYYLTDGRLVWRWVKGQGLYTESGDLQKVLGVVEDITDRKQAELTLANLEAEQRSILENIPSYVVKVDRAGTMLFVNQVAPGLTQAEVIGHNIQEFTDPSSREIQRAALAQIFDTGQPTAIETLGTGANGSFAYYDVRMAPIVRQGQIEAALLVTTDISDRKQAELALQQTLKALQTSELKLRQITDAIPGAVYQYQLFPSGDQCFQFMSAGVSDLYGITPEAACTDPQVMWDFISPSQVDGFAASVQHSAATLEPWNYEYSIQVDGQERWISGRALPTRQPDGSVLWNGIVQDITERKRGETERKRAEQALQIAEARYSLATRAAKVGVWEWHIKTGDFYIDPNIKALLGYTDAEIPNDLEQWVTYVHPDDRDAVMAAAQDYLDGTTLEYNFEHRMLHKDGSHVWILVRGQLLRDEQGNPERMLGTDTDISDRKQAELALQQLNTELEQRVQERTETLRQSEARYRAIVEDQTELVCRFLDDGTLTFVNQAYCRYFGQSPSELLGHSFLPLLPPEDQDHFRQKNAQLTVENPTITYEHQVIASDGSIRWQQWTDRAIFDDQQRVIEYQAVGRDISERKQAEAALRDSEARLRATFEQAAVGIVQVDLEGRLTQVNQKFCDMVGYSEAELRSTHFADITHPDDLASDQAQVSRLLTGESSSFSMEKRYIHADGSPVWVNLSGSLVHNASGEPHYFVGMVKDIGERKLAEAQLQEKEQFLRSIYEGVSQPIFVIDVLPDQTFRYGGWNPVTVELSGKTADEITGKSIQEVYAPEESAQILDCFAQCIATQRPYTVEECLTFREQPRWMLTTFNPLVNAEGRVYRIVGTAYDITDRKHLEQELRQINTELEDRVAERTAELQTAVTAAEAANQAKSTFLANMSHELRTPLNAILGFSQLMARDSQLSATHLEELKIINQSGEHLLALINDVLEMSKIEAGQVSCNAVSCDLPQLLDSLMAIFRLEAETKGLTFTMAYGPDVPTYIQTDSHKLRQVLINLLSNALKFTRMGQVELNVRLSPGADAVAADAVADEMEPDADCPPTDRAGSTTALHFEVKDSGCGIAADEFDQLFEPFLQTSSGRRVQSGTGLGLPISQRFVRLMGGRLEVKSEVGVGSTFSFELPVTVMATASLVPSGPQPRNLKLASDQPQYCLLVVEDNRANQLLLQRMLTHQGFDVQTANNGEEAIAQWQQVQPDLIFMDIRMPVMDGYAATQRIRELEQHSKLTSPAHHRPRTKIIALTANIFGNRQSSASTAGCDDFAHKPIQEANIAQLLTRHLGVQYQCEPDTLSSPSQPSGGSYVLNAADLQRLPKEWIGQFHTAIIQLDQERMFSLIADISLDHADMAQALKRRVHNFDYHALLELTQVLITS
jgi:PAS domain S-box-containing protein